MKTATFDTEKRLKKFVETNRRSITNINGIEFTEFYPILEVSNQNASYYNVEKQGSVFLEAPFNVTYKAD